MNLSPKKSILLNVIQRFRMCPNEGFHTSRFVKERDYYDVLNLDRKCDAKEIRESFIQLAKKYHPDTNQNDPKSHARFVELQKAYSVLSAPSKRREYDLGLPGVRNSQYNPYRRSQGETNDTRAYEDYFNDDFKDLFYRSRMKPDENPPRLRVGVLQLTFLFLAFTTVGAVVQYYVIQWLYRRNYNDEMERHHKGSAAYHALKESMDKQQEEYNIQKLRAAYYKEVADGPIGLHLVPVLIRPKLPRQESPNTKKEEPIENTKLQEATNIKK